MKNAFLTIICLFFCGQILSQELPMFTQNREFHSFLNPAAMPVDYFSQPYQPNQTAGISYRNQWSNFDGGPTTMTARYEYFSDELNSVFGGNLMHDKTGRFSRTGAYLRYAYKVNFSEESSLNIGGKFGAFQSKYDSSDGVLYDPGDVTGESNVNQIIPDFGIGIFFTQEFLNYDIFYAGLSIPQFTNKLGSVSTNNDTRLIHESTHLFLNTGLYKKLGRGSNYGYREIFIEPSVWVKYAEAAPIQTDFNFRVHLPTLLWVGLGYGVGFDDKVRGNFLHFEGGFVVDEIFDLNNKNIKIGFGYDNIFTNSTYGGFGSSFEVNLSYSWL